MRFNIITIFPEFFDSPLDCGLLGKAVQKGLLSFSFVNPRDFATDLHRSVDDRPYGGGPGMVMMADPLMQAVRSLEAPGRILFLTPQGKPFSQDKARELAQEENLTVICGRYEGIDARLTKLLPIEQISVGDFVMNGGETGALCVIEAVSRLLPDFIGCSGSIEEESFSAGLLEYPHYTRPEVYEDLPVPEVLTSGNHSRIAAWRREMSLRATLAKRSDLLESAFLSKQDVDILKGRGKETQGPVPMLRVGRNLYVALVHYPVVNKFGEIGSVSLTNLDLHDISRNSRCYGLGGFYVVTPIPDQQRLAAELTAHWTGGKAGAANPDRAQALSMIEIVGSLEEAVEDIERKIGQKPFVAATSASGAETESFQGIRKRLEKEPVLLLLGTGSGLAPKVLKEADALLPPLRRFSEYNHFSVRSAAALIMDRILGDMH